VQGVRYVQGTVTYVGENSVRVVGADGSNVFEQSFDYAVIGTGSDYHALKVREMRNHTQKRTHNWQHDARQFVGTGADGLCYSRCTSAKVHISDNTRETTSVYRWCFYNRREALSGCAHMMHGRMADVPSYHRDSSLDAYNN
jgi:hypothetical protein